MGDLRAKKHQGLAAAARFASRLVQDTAVGLNVPGDQLKVLLTTPQQAA